MTKSFRYFKLALLLFAIVFVATRCRHENKSEGETILKGTVTVISDATLTPIVEDQIAVFENEYDAHIKLISKSEAEAINMLINDSLQIAILSRDLTKDEQRLFKGKKIMPRVTKFATDGITFIRYKNNSDTIIDLKNVLDFVKGLNGTNIKGLVFDNLNSSTARYIAELSGIKQLPEKGIYSFTTNEDVIKYVSENVGMIGVIGLNWVTQPSAQMQPFIDNISVLSVKGMTDSIYYSPTQNNLAEGKYPLARDLFIVNCQGYSGLGMGFASFIAGEKGQRIILKSGLLPQRIPSRKILLRNQIEKSNK